MNVKLFTDSPSRYEKKNAFFLQGASPSLLKELIRYMYEHKDEIDEINACSYLFNNYFLDNAFRRLVRLGIKITVVSIPLEGYDNRNPQQFFNLKTGEFDSYRGTKESIARLVYDRFVEEPVDGYNLLIFPHMYARSPNMRSFSRGCLPYSLHMKSLLIKFKDGRSTTIMTSSNLAIRDLCKEEMMVMLEHEAAEENSCSAFYETLKQCSVPVEDFQQSADLFHFKLPVSPSPAGASEGFTAPFLRDSPELVEKSISDAIEKAKHRVYVCAQHVCAYNYAVPKNFKYGEGVGYEPRAGFLGTLLQHASRIGDVKILSQTFVNECAPHIKQKLRSPENKGSFVEFINACKENGSVQYAVNSNLHSKFIVIDDRVLVTSFNYTPTQFMYLEHVDIPIFTHVPDTSYSGVFCEVGQYAWISPEHSAPFLEYFDQLWNLDETLMAIEPQAS